MANAELFDIMYSMRAMRRLKPDPIPEATLKKIVEAGIHAPSGGNLQDWAFILVRDAEGKRFIRDHYFGIWQKIASGRTMPTNIPSAQMRMYQAAAHLADHLHEVPVILLACAAKIIQRLRTPATTAPVSPPCMGRSIQQCRTLC